MDLVITGCKGEFLDVLKGRGGENWGITLKENDIDTFDKDKLIYLTGDAEEEM